jgi:hypothetical protein
MKISIGIFAFLVVIQLVSSIEWKENWAFGCDFDNNDISNAQIRGEECGGKCAQTEGCTHFTWTTWNGGTCWMKGGAASKETAKENPDNSMVCGVMEKTDPAPEPAPVKIQRYYKHYFK